jgi:hypothetical protein
LFPIAPAFRLRQIDDGVKCSPSGPQRESREFVDEQTGQSQMVQRPTALGLHGAEVKGESFGNKQVSGRKIATPRPFETCHVPGIVNFDASRGQHSQTRLWRTAFLSLDQHVRRNPLGVANPAGPGPPTGDAIASVHSHGSAGHDGTCERWYAATVEHPLNGFVREEGTEAQTTSANH